MPLSINPQSVASKIQSTIGNPAANLPSYSGADSSLATNAAANLLGSGASQYSTIGSIPSINAGSTLPFAANPLAKLVSENAQSLSDAAAAASPGNLLNKLNLDSMMGQLSGEIGSGLNGMTAGILSKLPSAGAENSLSGGAALLGSGSGIGSAIDGAGAKLGSIGSTVSSISESAGGALGNLKSLAGSTSNIMADVSGALNKLAGGNLAGGIQKIAGGISATAGMVNNLLSLKRGINLPAGGELFTTTGPGITVEANSAGDWRVRISTNWDIFGSGNPMIDRLSATGGVVWPYLPTINYSTKANYNQIDLIHSNYPHQAYKNSQVDEIQISGEFSCETEMDAAYWIAAVTFFKTATKMFFGQGENAGNPPIICRLNGYGSNIFNNVPIVVKSFSVDLREDVNYIQCATYGSNTWVPVLSTISVVVTPVYNRSNLRKFNLQDYAKGQALTGSGSGYI